MQAGWWTEGVRPSLCSGSPSALSGSLNYPIAASTEEKQTKYPMSMPLFSASHAAQWDALSTSPRPSSTVPWSQDDHVHDIWHWHPSQWPLVLERTSSSSSTSTNGDPNLGPATATHTKTLLLSSRVRSDADLRYNHYSSQDLAQSDADDHAHESAEDISGNGHRPAQSLPRGGSSVFGGPACSGCEGGCGGHCRAGDNVCWQVKRAQPSDSWTANGSKRAYVSHSGQDLALTPGVY